MKVREGGRVVKTSVLFATGVNNDGYRELLDMQIATSESKDREKPPSPTAYSAVGDEGFESVKLSKIT